MKKILSNILFLLFGTIGFAQQNNPADWAHLIQGGTNTNISHVVSDGEYIYINGVYTGSSTTFVNTNLPYANGNNIVMAKLDMSGNVIWLNTIIGDGSDTFFDFQLDASGNLITTGWSTSQDDLLLNETEVLMEGDQSWTNKGMVAKFSATTGSLMWFKGWVSEIYKTVNPIRLTTDTSDNIYVAGYYTSDFDIDNIEFTFGKTTGEDIFLIKFDSTGNAIWGNVIETVTNGGFSRTKSITANSTGVYHMFEYNNALDINGISVPHFGGGYSLCITKSDFTTGYVTDFTTFGSPSGWQSANHIISDENDNLLITGHFTNNTNFEIGDITPMGYGGEDAFVAKMSPTFGLDWVKTMGGSGSDRGFNLYVRTNGEISLGGGVNNSYDLNYDENQIMSASEEAYGSAFQLQLTTNGDYIDHIALVGLSNETTISNNSTIILDNGAVFTAGRFAGTTTFLGWTEQTDHNKGFIMKWGESFSQIIESVEVSIQDDVLPEINGIGNTLQLIAVVNPEGVNQQVIWSIESGQEYTSVDEEGLVIALGEGIAIVRATSVEDETKYDEIQIEVLNPIESVEVSTQDDVLPEINGIGNTLQLIAVVNPEGVNQQVIWSIESGQEYTSVDEEGLVIALGEGVAIVRATSVEDETKYDEIEITVLEVMSIEELRNSSIKYYPNPFTSQINIETLLNESLQVDIYDALGKLVYSSIVEGAAVINLDFLNSGVYIMELKGELTLKNIKLIKK